jgi:hypothetical protein
MTLLQAVTYSFALVGAASVSYILCRFRTTVAEDGPIRVRGGSVRIENDQYDWEKDDSDGDNEFHYKGRPNRWWVKVLKNGAVCGTINGIEARRVELDIGRTGGGNDGQVKFRPNGAVRVSDDENRFQIYGKTLVDASAGARVKKVTVRKLDGKKEECTFDVTDTYLIELKPLA